MKINDLIEGLGSRHLQGHTIGGGNRAAIKLHGDKEVLAWVVVDTRATFIYTTNKRTLYAYQSNDEPFKMYPRLSLYELSPVIALEYIIKKIDEGCSGECDVDVVKEAIHSRLGDEIVSLRITSVYGYERGLGEASKIVDGSIFKSGSGSVFSIRCVGDKTIVLKKHWARFDDVSTGRWIVCSPQDIEEMLVVYDGSVTRDEYKAAAKAQKNKFESVSVRNCDLNSSLLKLFRNMIILRAI